MNLPISGRGNPAGDRPTQRLSPAGYIPCCICATFIRVDEYHQAACWADPHGISCAAHNACLRALGETDLGLLP